MAEQAQELNLEQRFANYAEQAHPESTNTDDVPRETKPVATEPVAEPETAVEPVAEPTQAIEPPRFEFETVEELANRLEVPVESILALKLKTKVDDQEAEFPLAEIQKGFQLDRHNQNKSKELSAAQQKADSARQQYEASIQAATQHLTNLNALGRYAQEMLNADVDAFNKSPDIQNLRLTDPTRYIIAKDELQSRQTQINSFVAQVNQQAQQQRAQADNGRQAQIAETMKNRATIRPEWADEKVFEKDTMAIRDAFLANGIKAEELPTLLTNPAYLKMADAATRWLNLQKQKPEVTQKVRTAPKLAVSNARTGQVKTGPSNTLKAQLKANPNDQDVAAAAFANWASESEKAGLI